MGYIIKTRRGRYMDQRTLLDYNAIAYMADRYGEFTPEVSSKIINWAQKQNGEVFYTREGQEFVRRLYAISRGENFDRFCVICGRPARNGAICNRCTDQFIEIDEDDADFEPPRQQPSRQQAPRQYSQASRNGGGVPQGKGGQGGKAPKDALAIVALVLGILALILPKIWGGLLGVAGLVVSIISLVKKMNPKGFAIAGIVLSLLGIIMIGGGSSSSDDKKSDSNGSAPAIAENSLSATDSATSAEAPIADDKPKATEIKDEYHVGDELVTNDMRIVYVSSGEYVTDNDFMQPQEGNKYIFMEFYFENLSTSDKSVSFYDFEGYADGYSVSQYYSIEPALSATLSAGRFTTGKIVFEVPQNANDIEAEYEANWITDKKIRFKYDGDKNSGFAVSANTEASADAYKVGESLSTKAFNITYLQCYEDTSYSEYFPPKDGCKFYTCELEFENISDHDQVVSMYEFDCYADGQACDQSFFRDDNLSATLSAGKKAKGTVTFEIPDSATSVELECETNIWTSNRLVFTIR